jgi:lipopolysaccharide/colanic/teichoic acid biosynthesis glycosyltransferase
MSSVEAQRRGQALLRQRRPLTHLFKRLIDFIGAACLCVVLAPVFLVIGLLVALDGGPVFYLHRRIGRYGVPFGCLKFRTMILGADRCLDEYLALHPEAEHEWQQEQKLTFDPRITPIGRFLRRTSLDELPQLINVLFGKMSLVGPRPVTQGELRHYGKAEEDYLSIRPGITGLWQISGRNDVSYAQRVALDQTYVSKLSLWGDAVILLKTPAIVLSKRGAR